MRNAKIIVGDVFRGLRGLPSHSVQCAITSPPYWGLRDYGTATWEGGDPKCDHRAPSRFDYPLKSGLGPTGSQKQDSNLGSGQATFRSVCGKCGAKRIDFQIGLESTPEEYVGKLVEVFREVRRVLRDDGTLWLNLGDSYARTGGWVANDELEGCARGESGRAKTNMQEGRNGQKRPIGLKEKDLVGIPWRVAFALQADGWWLRQDIIWSKSNPMPESTKDRCTKAHEYIFLLAKNQRYYYDAGSVAEEAQYGKQHANKATSWGTNRKHPNKANVAAYAFKGNNSTCHRDADGGFTRNLRSVWTITTKPFKGAHFATFPPLLVEPMIEAGSRAGDTVLDPFSGAGTTGLVALRRFRNFIGIELNPEYAEMSRERIANDNLLLNQVEVVHLLKGLVRPKRER